MGMGIVIGMGRASAISSRLTRWIERLPLGRHNPVFGWIATLAIFVAAWLLRIAVDRVLPSGFPYVTFFPAVIVTSFLFGVRLGSVSALLCGIVAWYYFVAPVNSFALDGAEVALAFYLLVVTTDIALVHGMQTANRQLIKEREVNRNLVDVKEKALEELQKLVIERQNVADALIESEVKTNLATQTAGIGLWQWHIPTGNVRWDSTMFELYGKSPTGDGSVQYSDYIASVHPDDAASQHQILQETAGNCGESTREFRIRRGDDGRVRHIRAVEIARAGTDGKTEWVVGTNLDVTEQKNRESHVQLLMGEVNHRAKNMLAVVMSVAQQTRGANHNEFMRHFSARLQSMAAGQDVLVDNEWRGVQIDTLVRAQLDHFKDLIGGRISLAGDDVFLSSSAVQTIGMALHELTTNASKYGALSNEKGHITLAWQRIQGTNASRFVMTWTESAGPPVVVPERYGFGSTVIGRMVRLSLDGEVTTDFAPSGFMWRLDCPLESVTDSEAQ
ncbi:MAG: HWE histidine kinase domain-containing protein [Pseudomonadota bacterium]